MYNLLVSGSGWEDNRDTIMASRVFEYTEDRLAAHFALGSANFDQLRQYPALFLEETHWDQPQLAKVGTVLNARASGKDVVLEYYYDASLPPITNEMLKGIAGDLGMEDFEFHRTHWALKDVDLFRILLRHLQPRRIKPRVFDIRDPEFIEPTLMSAMMPFHPGFDAVYETIKGAGEAVGLKCRRADDIWENPAIIQDVVSLIDRSRVVVCDCSGRNPNVFYEVGIAHTLGREVILITRSAEDIPFDLRHLRYVAYLPNTEGLAALQVRLRDRLASLI